MRARPTEAVSRWMATSSTPLLDRVALVPIEDPQSKLASVGLAALGLGVAESSPSAATEAYLDEQLAGSTVSTGASTSWMVPGVGALFHLVPWTARDASGVGRGEALIYGDGDGDRVVEVAGSDIELGGLLATVADDQLTVSGYVAVGGAEEPFIVQVEAAQSPEGADSLHVAQSDGRSALIEASTSVDDVLAIRVRSQQGEAPKFSALVAGTERVETQPLSFIDRLHTGEAGFRVDPSDRSPSQSAVDAAAQGVPPEVAELPLVRRVTPIGRASGGNYQALVDSELRWTMSRLPMSMGGDAEVLLIEGGVDGPATIRHAIELGAYRPSWVAANDLYVYAGRRVTNEPTAMVMRARVDGTDVVVVAQTESPAALPDGWIPATPDQVATIAEIVNHAPDLALVDEIIDGPEE